MYVRFRSASFVLVFVSTFILTSGISCLAQEAPRLDALVHPGSEVKIKLASGQVLQGTIAAASDTSLALRGEAEQVVQFTDIYTLQARVGRRPILLGALIGAGAAAGLVLVADSASDDPVPCSPNDWCMGGDFGPPEEAVAAILIVIGAGAGAGVGALMPHGMKEVYRAPIKSKVTVAPLLARGQLGLTVSLPF